MYEFLSISLNVIPISVETSFDFWKINKKTYSNTSGTAKKNSYKNERAMPQIYTFMATSRLSTFGSREIRTHECSFCVTGSQHNNA